MLQSNFRSTKLPFQQYDTPPEALVQNTTVHHVILKTKILNSFLCDFHHRSCMVWNILQRCICNIEVELCNIRWRRSVIFNRVFNINRTKDVGPFYSMCNNFKIIFILGQWSIMKVVICQEVRIICRLVEILAVEHLCKQELLPPQQHQDPPLDIESI